MSAAPQVRQVREAQGRRQVWLARQLGVTRQTLHSIEVGRSQPSLPIARAIADALGVAVTDVFPVEEVGVAA